jgi:hypothetical protein
MYGFFGGVIRYALAGHVNIDTNSQLLAGGEICEMSVEEWGNPFDMRGMTDVPDYMEMTQWGLAGRG